MNAPIQLLVYDPDDLSDERPPVSARRPGQWLADRPSWRPDPDRTLLRMAGLADPIVGDIGRLDRLAGVWAEAADRLTSGQSAILRTAGDFVALFIVLELDGDFVVGDALANLPLPYATYFPDVAQGPELARYIAAHRGELVPRREAGRASLIHHLRWPCDATIAALREDAEAARALVAYLDSTR